MNGIKLKSWEWYTPETILLAKKREKVPNRGDWHCTLGYHFTRVIGEGGYVQREHRSRQLNGGSGSEFELSGLRCLGNIDKGKDQKGY